jgi:hypothetical protein
MNKELFKLFDSIETIIKEAETLVVRSDTGNGMSPLSRRTLILRKSILSSHHFAVFLAVHMRRGTNWRLYANQSTEFAEEISFVAGIFGISTNASDRGVSSQVIANCFADLMIAYRKNRDIVIPDFEFETKIDQRYRWIGSLASMYLETETSENQLQSWIVKTNLYIRFIYEYVEGTGALTQKDQTGDDEDIARRILQGCHFAYQSWSLETRKAWFEGNYNFQPKSSDTALSQDQAVKRITCRLDRHVLPSLRLILPEPYVPAGPALIWASDGVSRGIRFLHRWRL